MKTFAVYSIKGGVGKTSSAVNLAFVSARRGARTLLWDLDPQGAATFYFRVRPKVKGGGRGLLEGTRDIDGHIRGSDFENLDILPADFSYRSLDLDLKDTPKATRRFRRILKPLRNSYDHIVIDCAPSISLVSESVFHAADALLVPTIPTPLSVCALAQVVKHLRDAAERPPAVLPFFSMVDRRKSLHRTICDDPRAVKVGFLQSCIPYSTVVEQMGLQRNPLPYTLPRHPVSLAYDALWGEALVRTRRGKAAPPPTPKTVRKLMDERPGRQTVAGASIAVTSVDQAYAPAPMPELK